MAEKEGFEPSHAFTSAGFRNQSLQPLGYFSIRTGEIITILCGKVIAKSVDINEINVNCAEKHACNV